jgi:hypothetical protein
MAQTAQSKFGYLDDPFRESEESTGFSKLPDGDYRLQVDCVSVNQNQNTGKWSMKWEMKVVGGAYNDQKVFKFSNIPDGDEEPEKAKTKLGMLKHDLKVAGVNVDHPKFSLGAFLDENKGHLNKLLDLVIDSKLVSQKNNPDRQNVNFSKLVDATEIGAKAETGAGNVAGDEEGDGAFDPFADE